MERQHVGTPVGIDRADVGGDVVGKLSATASFALERTSFCTSTVSENPTDTATVVISGRNANDTTSALGHILGAGRPCRHTACCTPRCCKSGRQGPPPRRSNRHWPGSPRRDRRRKSRAALRPRPSRYRSNRPRFRSPRRRGPRPSPLRSRLRRDDLHPIAAAPVDRPGAVRQRAVCRTGFSLRRLVAVVDRKGGQTTGFPAAAGSSGRVHAVVPASSFPHPASRSASSDKRKTELYFIFFDFQ